MTTGLEARAGFSFYRIYILESLAEGNLHTGRLLFRQLEAREDTEGHLEYAEIERRDQLFQALARIQSNLAGTGQIPLLHIEAHGGEAGLELANGDAVLWRDLRGPLTAINALCQMHLLVVFAACYGQNAVSMARVSEPAPLWGCLGPRERVPAGEIQDGLLRFYEELLHSRDLRAALSALPGGLPAEGKPFVLWPAEYFFVAAYRGYVLEECSDERIAERVVEIAREQSLRTGLLLSVDSAALQRIEASLRNHRFFFESYRRAFFMLGSFPDNRSRFRVEYRHVQDVLEDTD